MKTAYQLITLCVAVSSCTPMSPDEQFVHQKIPVEIQSGKPINVEIHSLSGNGSNEVGIRCSPEVWNEITNGTNTFSARLKSSNKANTSISAISPGSGRLWPLESYHYLFRIGGEYRAKASVEIIFPNAPTQAAQVEIIVCNTPADTGL